MALKYTAKVIQFDKVSGWSTGPLKPTTTTYTGTLSSVKSSLTSALDNLSNVTDGESFQIIVTAKDE